MQEKLLNLVIFGFITIIVVTASQVIGLLVLDRIPENTTLEINNFLHFTHIRNYGGVFGLLQGQGSLFAFLSGLLLSVVILYLILARDLQRFEYVCFGFIVGGGASNVLDRIIHGSVIDFIDLQHIPYWNYIFNTADVMVHVGIWPLLLLSFMQRPRSTDEQKQTE